MQTADAQVNAVECRRDIGQKLLVHAIRFGGYKYWYVTRPWPYIRLYVLYAKQKKNDIMPFKVLRKPHKAVWAHVILVLITLSRIEDSSKSPQILRLSSLRCPKIVRFLSDVLVALLHVIIKNYFYTIKIEKPLMHRERLGLGCRFRHIDYTGCCFADVR